jgi:acetate kinase
MIIMALNCGSSSVKYQLFDWEKKGSRSQGDGRTGYCG